MSDIRFGDLFPIYTVFFVLFFSSIFYAPTGWADCPAIGAIRWDAWYGAAYDDVGVAVENNLNTAGYKGRAPFCSLADKGHVTIECIGTSIMNEEMRFAISGGIDYWAFLAYAVDSPMSLALQSYLQTDSGGPRPHFSVILTPNSLLKYKDSFRENLERFARYTTRDDYQRVKDGLPLVFFFPAGNFTSEENNRIWLAKTVETFKARVKALGGKEPYLVLLEFNPEAGRAVAEETGFDAISTYATHGDEKAGPYKSLAAGARKFWEREKSTGAKVVPTVMAGWDRRLRVINPVPWERGRANRVDEVDYYYQQPTPSEIADHVADGIQWVRANPSIADANTLLIYAWNEHDEGGWLVPTLGEKDSRLKAIANKKRQECGGKASLRILN